MDDLLKTLKQLEENTEAQRTLYVEAVEEVARLREENARLKGEFEGGTLQIAHVLDKRFINEALLAYLKPKEGEPK